MAHKNKLINSFVLACFLVNFFYPASFALADEIDLNDSETPIVETVEEIIPAPEEIIEEPIVIVNEEETSTTTEEVMIETVTEEIATSTEKILESLVSETPTTIPETRTIRLKIITDSATIFDDEIIFEACKAKETDSEAAFSAYCAITLADVDAVWNFDFGPAYIDSIDGVSNDYALNKYWLYFKNLEFGFNSYDQEILSDGDYLLVENNIYPLKISVATTTPSINSTTTISVYEFGFVGWDGVWLPSATSTLFSSNDEQYEVGQSGTVDILISTTTPITFYATKNGFIDSDDLTIYPTNTEVSTTTIATTTETTTGGGGGSISHSAPDKEKMLTFLDNNQKGDGSFGGDLYTDWVAMAYGSASGHTTAKNKLKEFLKSDDLGKNPSITDYERRAMALMALGINPYTGGTENYISKIINSFDGTQFGDVNLFNDDVFAIIALRSAGYSASDIEIIKARDFIIINQEDNGSFDSPDVTAATIQALRLVEESSDGEIAITKAKNYILGLQVSDGGFTSSGNIGNNFSTSWILGALDALSVSGDSLVNNNKNPFDYLYSLQQSDGGIEDETTGNVDSRVWATAYAIVGAQEKTWNSIMKSFSKNTEIVSVNDSSSNDIATSSPVTLDTTPVVATTTEVVQITDLPIPIGEVLGLQTNDIDEENDSKDSQTTLNTATTSAGVDEDGKSNLAFAGRNQNKFSLWFGGGIAILGGILIIRKWLIKI